MPKTRLCWIAPCIRIDLRKLFFPKLRLRRSSKIWNTIPDLREKINRVYISRVQEKLALRYTDLFKVVVVTESRQVGKITMLVHRIEAEKGRGLSVRTSRLVILPIACLQKKR